DLGLIDEYQFVVQHIVAGPGPTLFAGLSERLELTLGGRQELRGGSVALQYQRVEITPTRSSRTCCTGRPRRSTRTRPR
ncbi:MAG: hypothetical protein ABIY48_12775, partial [Acidimicrobiales bacterium]